jgi:hypothetical protein
VAVKMSLYERVVLLLGVMGTGRVYEQKFHGIGIKGFSSSMLSLDQEHMWTKMLQIGRSTTDLEYFGVYSMLERQVPARRPAEDKTVSPASNTFKVFLVCVGCK